MGKSPARWIKSVLLGKKSSKSGVSKGKERFLNEKDVVVTAKVEETDSEWNPSLVSNSISDLADRSTSMQETENLEAAKVLDNEIRVTGDHQSMDFQRATTNNELSDTEKARQEKAVIALQAAFRGYLARRAFGVLKGIIRLQALIRGHLVRRQAVATLCCVMGIVKLQAIARGRHVRLSEIGAEVSEKCRHRLSLKGKLVDAVDRNSCLGIKKLTANAFVQKLLASSPNVMPLRLQYDSSNPNSVPSWLENWSASLFWKPIPRPKKLSGKKPQKKLGNNHMADAEVARPKKSVRRVPPANLDNPTVQTPFEFDKPKRTFRKIPSQPVEPPMQENPQIELEKIKRNLRKVHNPAVENSIQQTQSQPEVEADKPKLVVEKPSPSQPSHLVPDFVEKPVIVLDDKIKWETDATAKQPDVETTPEPVEVTAVSSDPSHIDQVDNVDQLDQATAEPKPVMETETENKNGLETDAKENSTGKENQKSGKKSCVPSYMQATASAKAKLRLQGSPRSAGQDGTEKNNISRRHSLPSSGNGRIASHSPRTQRAVNSSGKSGSKSEKSLLSSREGNAKPIQVEWKR